MLKCIIKLSARFLLVMVAVCMPAHHIDRAYGLISDQAQPSQKAVVPFVDVHVHPDPKSPARSVETALDAMTRENAATLIFMPPPFTSGDPERFDADVLLPEIKKHPGKLAILGGGGTLNAMIQDAVQSGDAGPKIKEAFKRQAEDLLRQGAAGFGEMTAEHLPGATPYQSAPPDHPLFLLLADIAAEHGVPIDLHMEAVPQDMAIPEGQKSSVNPPQLHANIAAFERLLAHNPRAHLVWAHEGWDNTGYRTPELSRRLLAGHPNLYMELKIDPVNPGKNSPLSDGTNGTIKPEWMQLFKDFPDRFVVGSDQHYPEPAQKIQRWEPIVTLLNQLPASWQQKIGRKNAEQLYLHPSRPSAKK